MEYLVEERTVSGASMHYGPFARVPEGLAGGTALPRFKGGRGRIRRDVPLQRFARPIGAEAHRFIHTERFEQNLFPGPTGGPDPRQDLFFWHALSSEAQVSIPVVLTGLDAGDALELRVRVHGATQHVEQPHGIELHWNGQSLGVFDFFGRRRHTITVSLNGVDVGEENDGVPEIAVGRLPITSPDQLESILESVRAFEAGHESMEALFAGDDSEGAEIAAAARRLASWAPSSRVREIDLNVEALEEARDRLLSMWNGSLSWVSCVGHGGVDRLATEGLLTSVDVAALVPTPSGPVVAGWTCNIARFDIPGYASLGEQLVVSGASTAVFSATGWSNHVDTDALRTTVTEAAFASDAETLGEAILRGHRAAGDAPVQLHRVYTLLGDPALRLRQPKAAAEPGSPSVGDPRRIGDLSRTEPGAMGSGSGCEIGAAGEPNGLPGTWLPVLGLALAIRCRRRRRRRRADLH